MGSLILPSKRSVQPQQAVKPSAHQPGNKALLSAILPGVRYDLANGKPLTVGSGGSITQFGNYTTLRGSGSANVGSIPLDLSAYSTITVTGIIKVDSWKTSDGQYDMLWELTADGNSNSGGFTFYNDGSTIRRFTVGMNGGSQDTIYHNTTARPSTGVFHIYSVIYDYTQSTQQTELQLYIDGVKATPAGTPDGGVQSNTATFANNTLNLLNRNAASLPTTGNMAGLFIHAGALSANDIASIAQNPWRILADEQQKIWFDAASGGVSGASSTTNANDSSSAAGTTTVTGSSATTNINDTSTASGTTTVAGSSATTNANDASSASGSVGNNISGTIATTNANDASAASGTTSIIGGIAATNGNDASSSAGTTTVTGTAATTNVNDTSTASGISGAVTGTISYTNENDTSSGAGTAGTVVRSDSSGGVWFDYPTGRKKQKKKEKEDVDEIINGLIDEALKLEVKLNKYPRDINKLSKKQLVLRDNILDESNRLYNEIQDSIKTREDNEYFIKRYNIRARLLLL